MAHCSVQDERLVAGGRVAPTIPLRQASLDTERAWTTLLGDLAQVVLAAEPLAIRCGPISAGQIRIGEHGPLWLAFGTSAIACELDRNLRGAGMHAVRIEMSPEALMGEPADARTDVWHLAAFLFRGLTNAPPVPGETAFEHLANLRAGRLRDPRAAGVSEALSATRARSLGPRSSRPTVEEFTREVRALRSTHP